MFRYSWKSQLIYLVFFYTYFSNSNTNQHKITSWGLPPVIDIYLKMMTLIPILGHSSLANPSNKAVQHLEIQLRTQVHRYLCRHLKWLTKYQLHNFPLDFSFFN